MSQQRSPSCRSTISSVLGTATRYRVYRRLSIYSTRRKREGRGSGERGAPGTSKGCNVGVLQRPSTGVACASPIPVALDEQCATALPKPSEIFRQNAAFVEKSDGQDIAEVVFMKSRTARRTRPFAPNNSDLDLEQERRYSTVTLLARFRGWSTFDPRFTAT